MIIYFNLNASILNIYNNECPLISQSEDNPFSGERFPAPWRPHHERLTDTKTAASKHCVLPRSIHIHTKQMFRNDLSEHHKIIQQPWKEENTRRRVCSNIVGM